MAASVLQEGPMVQMIFARRVAESATGLIDIFGKFFLDRMAKPAHRG